MSIIKFCLLGLSGVGLTVTTNKLYIELNVLNVVSLLIFAIVFAWGATDLLKRVKKLL